MNADDILQKLSIEIYEAPLSGVREEVDYPCLSNPLHLAVLLIDCDTEIGMNGIVGFLENNTGRFLRETIQALNVIGATQSAFMFTTIESAMTKHNIGWRTLRSDFANAQEWQVISFNELHGKKVEAFAAEVCNIAKGFSLFDVHFASDNCYELLCGYLQERIEHLMVQISERIA